MVILKTLQNSKNKKIKQQHPSSNNKNALISNKKTIQNCFGLDFMQKDI